MKKNEIEGNDTTTTHADFQKITTCSTASKSYFVLSDLSWPSVVPRLLDSQDKQKCLRSVDFFSPKISGT